MDEPSLATSWKADKMAGLDDDVIKLKEALQEEKRLHKKTKG